MENKAQRKVLIIIGLVLIIIALLAYVFSLFISESDSTDIPNKPNSDLSKETFRDEITSLTDESLVFGAQKIINDYYNFIFEEDTEALLSILDPLYVEENRITTNNVYSYTGRDYGITNYMAEEIYYNPNSSVTYYFINGSLNRNSIMGDEYQFTKGVSFLIIVDEYNDEYVLKPIETTDLFAYAEGYDMVERELESKHTFSALDIPVKNKLSTYLGIFVNFLIYNPQEAYSLLTDDTKNNYQNYDDFKNKASMLYQSFSSKVFSYSEEKSEEYTIYKIIDDQQNKFVIYESGIMNYKISY